MKLEFRHESLKNKFSLILFVYGLMNNGLKRIEKIIRENVLIKPKKKELGLKFNRKFKH